MKNNLAVLITCFNRKIKTLKCLENLGKLELPSDLDCIDVYLVDDGSTDGTYNAVKKSFPEVKLIKGTGSLFWNQGMRLAWETACSFKNYDFYLWLNDDVVLKKFALIELINCYSEVLNKHGANGLITGAFKNSENEDVFSYGGRTETENVVPDGTLQRCKYINGNAVLVSEEIFSVLGNLSSDYSHAMGDFDYGLRSLEAGFGNYTTKSYIGVCPVNGLPQWSNPDLSIRERIKNFYSPTGLNYKEYIVFRKRFWKAKWIVFAVTAYARVLFPRLYYKMKGNSL